MKNIITALLIVIAPHATASQLSDYLSSVNIENKGYHLELKKWLFVKPKLKLRKNKYHAGTPLTHPVAKTLTTFELVDFLKSNTQAVTINVLGGKKEQDVILGGYWVKGVIGHKNKYKERLQLVLEDMGIAKNIPIIIYCLSAKCWNSYNVVIHAHNLGYTNLIWYRGGQSSWKAAGLAMQSVSEYQINN